MEIVLRVLAPGCWGTVTRMEVTPALEDRLRSFGLIPGTRLCPRYRSPDGTVTAIELRGAVLALRTQDLETIWVQPWQ